ncbi:hypothetical protein [Alicyclobacillus sp. SO9]|uniref:hypothetical protein n=1 Tax=Alicyclobacillus sp. SO9 TaxID=2665646 RepID=UPI0018E8EDE5|nr:hypothetical protein [Alicyclobacillus sp. SO9]QQE79258.1 hypothetical protein GI364_01730 [Alicyclobacillus sp. SO9]
MEYRVNAGATFRAFTMLLLILFVAADIAGQPNHQSLVLHLGLVTLILWLILRFRFISRYRRLRFESHSLRFAKRTVDARDIDYIFLDDAECSFKIVFRESLIPVRLSYSNSESKSVGPQIRQWASANHVPIRTTETGNTE